MEYRVVVSREAHSDIDEILSYMINTLKNPVAADSLLHRIEAAYETLADNPYLYAFCQDHRLKADGYRKVIIKNYILIYRVEEQEKQVYVVRVFYGRRNYAELI